MRSALKQFLFLVKESAKEWSEDGASRVAAALAYYAIFSLSPLLIIVAVVLGFAIDQQTLESNLVDGVQTTVGQQAAEIVRSLIVNIQIDRSSIIGTIVSLSIVVWGASNLFAQLQFALNRIWEVRPRPGSPPIGFFVNRFESFGILGIAAIALLTTTIINMALNHLIGTGAQATMLGTTMLRSGIVPVVDPGLAVYIVRPIQVLVSVTILTGIIAMIFKILPDVIIDWKDVLIGSLFTAVLLFIGQFLVGLYLSNSNVGSVFGAAGSLTAILVWVYYSAQILLFGAEFTEVWARHHGVAIRPNRYAIWMSEYQARREAEKAGVDFEVIRSRHADEIQRQDEAWDAFTARSRERARRVAVEVKESAQEAAQRAARYASQTSIPRLRPRRSRAEPTPTVDEE
jgi:membrane protein